MHHASHVYREGNSMKVKRHHDDKMATWNMWHLCNTLDKYREYALLFIHALIGLPPNMITLSKMVVVYGLIYLKIKSIKI